MRITRFFRTAGFRYAALTAILFALGSAMLSTVIYFGTRHTMELQLQSYVISETTQLMGDYREHGLKELQHDIRERLERAPNPRLRYALASPDGVVVFDRLIIGSSEGWQRERREGLPDLLILTTELEDGYRLAVAAEAHSVVEFGRAIRKTLSLAVFTLLVISVLVGIYISRRFLVHLGKFKKVADAVGDGELSARIPIHGVGDDFEQLATTINRMLERIELLVKEIRHVSVSIAHDLRTPLGRLRQRLEKLETLQREEEAHKLAHSTIELLDETLGSFTSLLRLGELQSGRKRMAFADADLQALTAGIAETYAPVAEENDQKLMFRQGPPALISADSQLLSQLIVNLVENAIKHNGPGTRINLEVKNLPDDSIRLRISDDGIGVDPTLWKELFRPFFKVDKSRAGTGSGLGMSIAAAISDQHGASLSLEDNHPGLAVVVTFPPTASNQ